VVLLLSNKNDSNKETKMTPYKIMKSAIDNSYEPTLKEKQNINPFFLLRFVSNDPNTIYIANMLNIYKSIPIEIQYNFIKNSSLEKIAFINYPKKHSGYDLKEINVIKKYYSCNTNTAKDYIDILGPKRVQEIIEKYNYGLIGK